MKWVCLFVSGQGTDQFAFGRCSRVMLKNSSELIDNMLNNDIRM